MLRGSAKKGSLPPSRPPRPDELGLLTARQLDRRRLRWRLTLPLLDVNLDWRDPECPWWVKLRRAGVRLNELHQAVGSFRTREPWRLVTEDGRRPGEVAYRFRTLCPIPTDIAVTAGEVVHSLRSALDSVVFELARKYAGSLTPKQERTPAFKSFVDEESFRESMERKLRDLCGEREIAALRSVQPFAFAAEAAAIGVNTERQPGNDLVMDVPNRLDVLWNIDKHRRLLKLAWYVDDLVFWPECGKGGGWTPALDCPGPLADGALIGYFRGGEGYEERSIEPTFEFFLRLTDDPCAHPEDLCKLLSSWHDTLGCWVVPRMFITANTDGSPPILIPGGWPYR